MYALIEIRNVLSISAKSIPLEKRAGLARSNLII
jgi:hypothetical protein